MASVERLCLATRPQVLFHLASKVTGSRQIDMVLPTLRDNLVGTVHVLTAASQAGCERVICLGSLQEPDEQLTAIPNSPYAAAKFAAGAYARMFADSYGLPVSIGRPFMVYGPGQLDFAKLVPYVLSKLLRGEVAQLSGGHSAFDWVYVDDVADALIALAARQVGASPNVDIGTGVLTSVRDIVQGLANRLGAGALLQLGAIPDRNGEPIRCADAGRTERLIGWRSAVGVEDGLDRTVAWYRRYFGLPNGST
jgi:nucleoside-diphosphate-sugar epimerase